METEEGFISENDRMTVVDARKTLQIMNDCCKGLVFAKGEISQIATICLRAIERAESEVEE